MGNILLVNANKSALLTNCGKGGKNVTALQGQFNVCIGVNLITQPRGTVGILQGKHAIVSINANANLFSLKQKGFGNTNGEFLIHKVAFGGALQILGCNSRGDLNAVGGGVGGNYGCRNGCILRGSVL